MWNILDSNSGYMLAFSVHFTADEELEIIRVFVAYKDPVKINAIENAIYDKLSEYGNHYKIHFVDDKNMYLTLTGNDESYGVTIASPIADCDKEVAV